MQRFYLPAAETHGETLTLSDREAHHALHVVRLRRGETVEVLNGTGERLRCETSELNRREVRLRVLARDTLPPRKWSISLVQAIPKGKTFDTILQKATELGASRIVPLLTQRVVAQIEPDRHATKLEHWNAIAIESIKQCGSPWLPTIEAPIALHPQLAASGRTDVALASPPTVRLVASLRDTAQHPWEILERLWRQPDGQPRAIEIWVGPEGDFTDEELDAIEATGARPITLGPLVLRADTAAIYCLSVVHCAMQRREAVGDR